MFQEGENGCLHPCAYVSRKFNSTERNWSVWDKEAMAFKLGLTTWCHLLEGAGVPFKIWADKNLEAVCMSRWLGAKQLRRVEFFSKFQFTLQPHPRKKKFLVDALACLPQHDSQREEVIDSLCTPRPLGVLVTIRSQAKEPPLKR